MREKDIQQKFKEVNNVYGAFELKLCKKSCILFNAVREWQIQGLLDISGENGLYHKISDQPIFSGMRTSITYKKPFDCFYLKFIPAYVVVCFWEERKKKNFYYIPIQNFLNEMKISKRKSLTEDRARAISSKQLLL